MFTNAMMIVATKLLNSVMTLTNGSAYYGGSHLTASTSLVDAAWAATPCA